MDIRAVSPPHAPLSPRLGLRASTCCPSTSPHVTQVPTTQLSGKGAPSPFPLSPPLHPNTPPDQTHFFTEHHFCPESPSFNPPLSPVPFPDLEYPLLSPDTHRKPMSLELLSPVSQNKPSHPDLLLCSFTSLPSLQRPPPSQRSSVSQFHCSVSPSHGQESSPVPSKPPPTPVISLRPPSPVPTKLLVLPDMPPGSQMPFTILSISALIPEMSPPEPTAPHLHPRPLMAAQLPHSPSTPPKTLPAHAFPAPAAILSPRNLSLIPHGPFRPERSLCCLKAPVWAPIPCCSSQLLSHSLCVSISSFPASLELFFILRIANAPFPASSPLPPWMDVSLSPGP